MNDDASAPLDLESAYRQALRAVSETEVGELDDSEVSDPNESAQSAGESNEPASDEALAEGNRVSPRQILEAALFVGGVELTGEKLASLLKGEFTADSVGRIIEEMNRRYRREQRPYEIRLEEGCYRLALREPFEHLRRRVYGLGPKEVKLSQDALEVLSLVAYRQPISREAIESLREGNAGNVLRQLVRRGLIAIDRSGERGDYRTTERFLDVFGLAGLEELPRAESLEFK